MSRRVTSFDAAEAMNAYELASWWGDRLGLPHAEDREAADELCELAVMSALRAWLGRWQPIHIHRAILAGASLAEVAEAMGVDPVAVAARWRAWADGQRQLVIRDRPGVTAREYQTVRDRLEGDATAYQAARRHLHKHRPHREEGGRGDER
ncbi:MAG: hypothetical protein ACRDQA_08620 [Nocardioidaceae bacterium]